MFVEIRAVVPAIEEKIAKFQADYDANKAEANRYKGQVDKWKRQMDAAHSGMDNAKKEKETLIKKIEKFILDVYELNWWMNRFLSWMT